MIKKILLIAAGLLLLAGCSAKKSTTTITISAAASLKDSLTEVAKSYENAHPATKVELDFAGSGSIREKVTSGAPIDGVVLASQSDIDKLGKKITDSQIVLGNELVIITSSQSGMKDSDTPSMLNSAQKIAIGQPDTVPAGMYAKQYLDKLGLYSKLQPKFVEASDVTQVLSYVAAGNADLGFVYKTDALTLPTKVEILETVPESGHDKIIYLSAVAADSGHTAQVKSFNSYLKSSACQKVFQKYGFITE